MDGLFPYLRQYCTTEELIKDFHALVHADDTLIISTQRDKFIAKCNHMLEYFKELEAEPRQIVVLHIEPKEDR